ncbi:MAG: hypothetical protein ACERK6_13435 [Candidatus Aminicenantaceae bacterium]
MSARDISFPSVLVPLLLLTGIFFPLLLYILPLLFYFVIVCLYAKPQGNITVSSRNVRDVSNPRGPPRYLLFS